MKTTTPANSVETKQLLIVGSSTMAPMIEEMVRQFSRRHPGVEFVVEAAGSGHGARDTMAGRAAIGMVARSLKAKEQALFAIPIARDGAALVVHKSNPIEGLSRDQARDIFTGRINNWKALGGPSQPIELLMRARGQGVTEVVRKGLGLKTEEVKLSQEVLLNQDVVKAVTSRPYTLSILSIGVMHDVVEQGLALKALTLDGIEPGSDSIRNGSWPMSRPLTLVTRIVPLGPVQEFIQLALSPEAQTVIMAHDFIPY